MTAKNVTKVVVVGPSGGLVEMFRGQNVDVTAVEGIATRDVLVEAGTEDADAVVVTDVGEASAIPVVRSLDESVHVVVYDHRSMPEFVRAQVDLAIAPDVLDPETVAEEITNR
jgi:Trk K+ transport system NAD-binding subunit